MEKINGRWMHDGKEYEVVEGKCYECPFVDGDYCKLTPSKCREDLGSGKRFKLKENQNMIRPFKCAAMTTERVEKIFQAIKTRDSDLIEPSEHCKHAQFIFFMPEKPYIEYAENASFFVRHEGYEEMTFDQALSMILAAPVLKKEPVFDIKLRDEVLCRDKISSVWEIKQFARIRNTESFQTFGAYYRHMLPFKGNEHLHGTTNMPDGWWECKKCKPVWITE